MKWRPENWTYGDGYSKPQRKCLHGKGRVRAFEAGADAMLTEIRKRPIGVRVSDIPCYAIPDDPQPSEKPAEPQLYICPKAKECKTCEDFPGRRHDKPHEHAVTCDVIISCPACVPYVPEKETISGWWLNHITGKQEFATINIPPFIKVKIEDNQGYHLQHPASKVIESGYLEIVFGKGLVEVPKLSYTFTSGN